MKNKAAVKLGSMTSDKKIAAVRENGKLGGRPITLTLDQQTRKVLIRLLDTLTAQARETGDQNLFQDTKTIRTWLTDKPGLRI